MPNIQAYATERAFNKSGPRATQTDAASPEKAFQELLKGLFSNVNAGVDPTSVPMPVVARAPEPKEREVQKQPERAKAETTPGEERSAQRADEDEPTLAQGDTPVQRDGLQSPSQQQAIDIAESVAPAHIFEKTAEAPSTLGDATATEQGPSAQTFSSHLQSQQQQVTAEQAAVVQPQTADAVVQTPIKDVKAEVVTADAKKNTTAKAPADQGRVGEDEVLANIVDSFNGALVNNEASKLTSFRDLPASAKEPSAQASIIAQLGGTAMLNHFQSDGERPSNRGLPSGNGDLGALLQRGLGSGRTNKVREGRGEVMQQETIDKLKKIFLDSVQTRQGNTVTMKLDPVDLGNVTVKVSYRADQVYAKIQPETAEAEQSLRQRLPELSQLFAASGFKPENIHVQIGRETLSPEELTWREFAGSLGGETGAFQERFLQQQSGSGHDSDRRAAGALEAELNLGGTRDANIRSTDQAGWVA